MARVGMWTRVGVLAGALLCLPLTGCGDGAPAAGTAGGGTAGVSAPPGYGTVRVSDCAGHVSTFTAPPRRVVTLTPSVLEMLFWLGVGDRVVGQGVPPKPGVFPPQFDQAVQRIPKLSGAYRPGAYQPVPKEALLNAAPDFVIGGFGSNFSAPGAASQQDLAAAGVNSYLALSTACSAATTRPQENLDLVYQDLGNLGRVFGVSGRAAALQRQMQARVEEVARRVRGAPVPRVFPFEFDEGTVTPYAPGNRQTINAVIRLAGGRNIFADVDRAYVKTGWEEIVKRDPEIVLVIVYDTGSVSGNEEKFRAAERFLTSFPGIANVTAVKERRFARLLYERGSVGGVRNAEAVAELARQLHPERFAG